MPDITIAAALLAGLLSFISPCCLPIVPAYLGQLGVVAVNRSEEAATLSATLVTASAAGGPQGAVNVLAHGPAARPSWRSPERWRSLPLALAFVFGFGTIFTVLGLTAYVAAGPIRENLPILRQVGGIVLIVLGLNLMGVVSLSRLMRSWRPLDRFLIRRGRPVGGSPGGAFTLGAIFAIGWTPCIGPTLGAILALSAFGATPQAALGFVAYSIGLAIPFLVLALAVDQVQPLTRRLLRHARLIELLGGGLVVVIGLAILFDWLTILARTFSFLWPQV